MPFSAVQHATRIHVARCKTDAFGVDTLNFKSAEFPEPGGHDDDCSCVQTCDDRCGLAWR